MPNTNRIQAGGFSYDNEFERQFLENIYSDMPLKQKKLKSTKTPDDKKSKESKYTVNFGKSIDVYKDGDLVFRYGITEVEYLEEMLYDLFETHIEMPINLKIKIIRYAFETAYSEVEKFIGSHTNREERDNIHDPSDDSNLSEEDI